MAEKENNNSSEKKRVNQQKDENKYVEGSAKTGVADLNEITFKNAQAQKLLNVKKQREREAANKSSKNESTKKGNLLNFGGTTLGSSRMKLHRKKDNKVTRR